MVIVNISTVTLLLLFYGCFQLLLFVFDRLLIAGYFFSLFVSVVSLKTYFTRNKRKKKKKSKKNSTELNE